MAVPAIQNGPRYADERRFMRPTATSMRQVATEDLWEAHHAVDMLYLARLDVPFVLPELSAPAYPRCGAVPLGSVTMLCDNVVALICVVIRREWGYEGLGGPVEHDRHSAAMWVWSFSNSPFRVSVMSRYRMKTLGGN